jgi:glutamine amidotransferase-like uncharacterized protein
VGSNPTLSANTQHEDTVKTAKILVHDPILELDCAHAVASALKPEFKVQMITLNNLRYGLYDCDLLVVGGGIGDSDLFYDIMTRNHIRAIQDYVEAGGKYLGICMGAYWASSLYFDLVPLAIGQYIVTEDSGIDHEYPTVAKISWQGVEHNMYFYDGCTFHATNKNTEIVARYQNGYPMAVIENNQIGLIGCHPESEPWWFIGISHDYSPQHAELLKDFAIRLVCEA